MTRVNRFSTVAIKIVFDIFRMNLISIPVQINTSFTKKEALKIIKCLEFQEKYEKGQYS